MTRFRNELSRWLIRLAQLFGTKLRDKEGKVLCKAFFWVWGGNIHVIGLPRDVQLRPVPSAPERLSYWRRSVTWEHASAPDFSSLNPTRLSGTPSAVCHIVICHLSATKSVDIFKNWKHVDPDAAVLLAYGGNKEEFDKLPPSVDAIYIADLSLRTTDHARQRQQYSGIFQAASHWISERSPATTHVHLVEFDAVPLTPNVGNLLATALRAENADVMGYGLLDISGTIHPHYGHEINNSEFMEFLRNISRREVHDRILSMLGCSSIWERSCFDNVAALVPSTHVYLEIGMPSVAHHLGYRVRPVPTFQEQFVTFEGDRSSTLSNARQNGAWLVHPCKQHWQSH